MKVLFAFALCLAISICAYAQDTVAMRKIVDVNKKYELQFIEALRKNDIDKCLSFFTDKAVNDFGRAFLLSELVVASENFKNYGDPEVTYSTGFPQDGIGTFGHDVDGTVEIECHYNFQNKKGDTYFNIYYSNASLNGEIQTFTTKASIEKELQMR